MNIKVLLISFFLFFYFSNCSAAQKYNLSGFVTDENKEPLVGVVIIDLETRNGISTNYEGFFTLKLNEGVCKIQVSYIGFETKLDTIELKSDFIKNYSLEVLSLKGVEIRADKKHEEELRNPIAGLVSLNPEEVKKLPAIGGESDIIKALALTPGVTNGSEGSSGLYVRGGTPDQNLILLDETEIFNPNHLFGFLSVFNTDALKSVDLIKGGFPARYGGRLSSVLDITMKEGNLKKWKGNFGVGLISSKLYLDGPIVKDKVGFMFSARSSYLDVLTFPLRISYNNGGAEQYLSYLMYDINSKLRWKIDSTSQLVWSFYRGSDRFRVLYDDKYSEKTKSTLAWGNITSSLRYSKALSNTIFWRNTFVYSQFRYGLDLKNESYGDEVSVGNYGSKLGIRNAFLQSGFDIFPNESHKVKLGLKAVIHQFIPQDNYYYAVSSTDTLNKKYKEKINAKEAVFFVEDEIRLGSRVTINAGIRGVGFFLTDTTYYSLEPRLFGSVLLSENVSLKIGFSQTKQFVHLLTNSSLGLQNDLWVPATRNVAPQQSAQYNLGVMAYIPSWNTTITSDVYYKKMKNLIEFSQGVSLINNTDRSWQNIVEGNGKGSSYGFELFAKYKGRKLNSTLAYTLSKTDRSFNTINNGASFPFKYDFRNNLSITIGYQISKKWDCSLVWTYHTGQAVTLPERVYTFQQGNTIYDIQEFGKRNSFRFPAYHRADIAFNNVKTTKKGNERTWSFSIYNLYNRQNIYYMLLLNQGGNEEDYGKAILVGRSLLPIIPSISYSYKF